MNPVTHRLAHPTSPGVALAVDDYRPPASIESIAGPRNAVFLPGFGSVRSGEKATRLGRDLPPHGIRFLTLDFQGLGDSTGEFRTLTLERQRSDYHCVRDRVLEGAPHVLIGSSMGGLVATMAAAADPERVRGLVLIAPAFGFRARFERQLGPEAVARWEQTNDLLYQGEFVRTHLAFDLLRDARRVDELDVASRVKQPVLVIHGDADDIVPFEESVRAVAAMRAPVELVRVAGGTHRLDAHLDLLSDRIRKFLASIAM